MKTIACLCLALTLCAGLAVRGQPAKKVGRVQFAKGVTLEVEDGKRRVLIESKVCLRQGQLEQLLTRKRTKEHEAILVADVDARKIHEALLVAEAEPGSPVKLQPKFAPPSGTTIKVSVEYQENGKTIRRPAQDWVRDHKSRKELRYDWVFAGSRMF